LGKNDLAGLSPEPSVSRMRPGIRMTGAFCDGERVDVVQVHVDAGGLCPRIACLAGVGDVDDTEDGAGGLLVAEDRVRRAGVGSVDDEEQRFSGSSGGVARVESRWLRTAARCRPTRRRVPLVRGSGQKRWLRAQVAAVVPPLQSVGGCLPFSSTSRSGPDVRASRGRRQLLSSDVDEAIFRFPGDETGVVGFGEAWMGAVLDLPVPGRDGGAGGGPGERSAKRS
jgi:hypothetical protein